MENLPDTNVFVKRKRNIRNVYAPSENDISTKQIKSNGDANVNKLVKDIADTSIENENVTSQSVENVRQITIGNNITTNDINSLPKKSDDIPYSYEEDKKIIVFFQKNMDWSNLNYDDEFFSKCLADNSTYRTADSIKNRFLNHILPNLHKYSVLSVEEMLLFYDRAGVDFPPDFEEYINGIMENKEQDTVDSGTFTDNNEIETNEDILQYLSNEASLDANNPQFNQINVDWNMVLEIIQNRISSSKNICTDAENLYKNVELFKNTLEIFEKRFAKIVKSKLNKPKKFRFIKSKNSKTCIHLPVRTKGCKMKYACTCIQKNNSVSDSASLIDNKSKNNQKNLTKENTNSICSSQSNVNADSEFSSPVIPRFVRNKLNVIDVNKLMCREIEMCDPSNIIVNNHCNTEQHSISENVLDLETNISAETNSAENNFNDIIEFKVDIEEHDLEMKSIKAEESEENTICLCRFTEQEICSYCKNNEDYQPVEVKLEVFKDEYESVNSPKNICFSSNKEQENKNNETRSKSCENLEIQNILETGDKDISNLKMRKNLFVINEQEINQNKTKINFEVQNSDESSVIVPKNCNNIKIQSQQNENEEPSSLLKINCASSEVLENIEQENDKVMSRKNASLIGKTIYLTCKCDKQESLENNLVRKPVKYTYTNKKRNKQTQANESLKNKKQEQKCVASMEKNNDQKYRKSRKRILNTDKSINPQIKTPSKIHNCIFDATSNFEQEGQNISKDEFQNSFQTNASCPETNDINSEIIGENSAANIDVNLNSSREILPISFSNCEVLEEAIPDWQKDVRFSSNEISVLKFKDNKLKSDNTTSTDLQSNKKKKVVLTYFNHEIYSIKVMNCDQK